MVEDSAAARPFAGRLPLSQHAFPFLTLDAIAPELFESRVCSALEGVMDRYQMGIDKLAATVPPFQGGQGFGSVHLGLRAARFTPGCHRAGFQPSACRLIGIACVRKARAKPCARCASNASCRG